MVMPILIGTLAIIGALTIFGFIVHIINTTIQDRYGR